MTTPKSEEEILDAFTESGEFYVMPHRKFRRVTGITSEGEAYDGMAFDIQSYLRSALASYLMHLKEEIPEKDDTERIERLYGKRFVDGVDKWGGEYTVRVHSDLFGHNSAIDQVHTLLDKKIRKLTEYV